MLYTAIYTYKPEPFVKKTGSLTLSIPTDNKSKAREIMFNTIRSRVGRTTPCYINSIAPEYVLEQVVQEALFIINQ